MQLFSVGLYKLNMDGSIIYQENGNPVDSYSIDDIVSYARAWTGFVEKPERGGAASSENGFQESKVDPMRIDIDKRDLFPKNDLDDGFIVSSSNIFILHSIISLSLALTICHVSTIS